MCVVAVSGFLQDLIAVKQLSLRNADQAEELYTEIELMRQLTHPNIVCYLGAEVRKRLVYTLLYRILCVSIRRNAVVG